MEIPDPGGKIKNEINKLAVYTIVGNQIYSTCNLRKKRSTGKHADEARNIWYQSELGEKAELIAAGASLRGDRATD